MQSTGRISPLIFGDGLRCVGGTLKRPFAKNVSVDIAHASHASAPSVTSRSAALGEPIPSGGTRYCMAFYRDASASFCPSPPGATFNVSNAISIVW